MTKILRSVTDEQRVKDPESDDLIRRAAVLGFALANYQTETGQQVWEWRQGDGPRPQFVTERVARQWMAEWIERSAPSDRDALAPRRSHHSDLGAPQAAESA